MGFDSIHHPLWVLMSHSAGKALPAGHHEGAKLGFSPGCGSWHRATWSLLLTEHEPNGSADRICRCGSAAATTRSCLLRAGLSSGEALQQALWTAEARGVAVPTVAG